MVFSEVAHDSANSKGITYLLSTSSTASLLDE
jgi:hypothetical protein